MYVPKHNRLEQRAARELEASGDGVAAETARPMRKHDTRAS